MKRWVWLLAVPYAVIQSSSTGFNRYPNGEAIQTFGDRMYYEVRNERHAIVDNFLEREIAEDIAEALNAAHERRINKEFKVDVSSEPCRCNFSRDEKCGCISL